MISATKKWIFLKISSVILVPLMLWFIFNLVSFYDRSYEEVLLFFTSQPTKFIFSLFIIFAYFYSALSISEVFEDYIEDEKLKYVANRLLYLFAIIIPISILLLLFKLNKKIIVNNGIVIAEINNTLFATYLILSSSI